MYAIAAIRTVLNDNGKNDFEPDINPINYTHKVTTPVLNDISENRLEKNWCILWLPDPDPVVGNIMKLPETLTPTLWGDLTTGRRNQITAYFTANQINYGWITNSMTVKEIVLILGRTLQADYKGRE